MAWLPLCRPLLQFTRCPAPGSLHSPTQEDAPEDYEPPHFLPATEEQANGSFASQPFSMKVCEGKGGRRGSVLCHLLQL